MKKTLAMFTLVLTLALQPLLATRLVRVAHASPATLELINPADGSHLFNYTTSQKSVGDVFLVNVTVTDVVNLYSWQIGVAWDPTLLNFSRIIKPPDMVFAGKAYLEGIDASTPGYLVYGQGLINPADAVSKTRGTLIQIELKIINAPLPGQTLQCNISFENIPRDTFMIDKNGLDISFTPINAQYQYIAPWTPPPPATIYLNPQKVVDISLTPSNFFNVSLEILNATGLHSWSLNVVFNGTILDVNNAFEGDFLKSAGVTNFNFHQSWLNATHKVLRMNCSLVEVIDRSGSGKLAEITFQVLELGSTSLKLKDIQLLNPLKIQLPYNSRDGFFSNVLIAKLGIEPSEVRGPQYVPGTTFQINVTLSDVENLKTCIFNLTYNPLIIQEISITTLPVAGKSPLKKLIVDDTAGFIWANVTYKNGVAIYGSAVIMSVDFQVLSAGVSPINLTQTALYNVNNEAISHEVYHGIFIGLIRDIAITNVELDLHVAYQGWQVKINVTVKNKGNITETFDVKVYANSSQIASEIVAALEPETEITLTLIWNTATTQPCNIYKISAQAGPVPFEISTADNFFEDGEVKIRFMGDVNGDGKVDMRDATASILCFRAYPGHPKWNPEMDLDRNNIIDMRDVVLIAINFNKSC